jgi:hypothetical protein
MMGDALQRKLQPLKDADDLVFRRWMVSGVLLAGAGILVVMIWLAAERQWFSGASIFALVLAACLLVVVSVTLKKQRGLDLKKLARQVEGQYPELQQALVTAVEQRPGPDGRLGFLQERVIEEAVDHAMENDWLGSVFRPRLLVAAWVQGFAIANALVMLVGLLIFASRIQSPEEAGLDRAPSLAAFALSVTPGDAEVERGQRLIVEARFDGRIPSGVEIVVTDSGGESGDSGGIRGERGRIAMKQGLEDGVFSGLVTQIDHDVQYRIEYDGERSEDFDITTYVHPELERSDVVVTPPAYAGLGKTEMKDVRKVSALEGSELAFRLQVNKPVAAAELFGGDDQVIPLVPSKEDETILEAAFVPEKSHKYRVHLVDAQERANKEPPWLEVTVQQNLPPKLDLVFPKRDLAVSAVQELPLEAQVWDDLGVTGAGAVFVIGDREKEVSLSEMALAGGRKHPLQTLLAVEELKVKPRDLISYYLWAEDRDAEGKVRRVMSDMFFAEVRHFEDIFREAEAMNGKSPPKQGESDELVDLQKKVINATWKLVRQSGEGRSFEKIEPDVEVVRQSQGIVAEKVEAALEKVKDPQIRVYLESAKAKMLQAGIEMGGVLEAKEGRGLAKSMKSSRGAYEDLLLAQSREHQVTRAQNPQPSQGGKQKLESQLLQLELKQEEKRYETASEAKDQPEQTAEQRENLAVLNRLEELARRQEALAKKIKELENALEKANAENEKEELKKQLKRLQEEQEQLLRELDDVTERMEQPQNRANMGEEKERLAKTREQVRKASEELKNENLADAANAATRAQRELDEVKEDFRKKTSRRFAEEMRAVRERARELAKNQKAIGERLEQSGTNAPGANNDPFRNQESLLENLEIGRDLDRQRKELGDLLEEMRRVSEASDGSEALLSTALYEAVRKAQTKGLDEALAEARDLGRIGRSDLAQESEGRAAQGIDELKKDVEKAAGKILGNEGDALRMARSELDDLLRQAEQEKQGLQEGKAGEKAAAGEKMELASNDTGQKKGGAKDEGSGSGTPQDLKPGTQKSEKGGEGKAGKGEAGEEGEEGKPGGGKGEKPGEAKPTEDGEGKGETKDSKSPGGGQGKEGSEPGEGKGELAGQGKGETGAGQAAGAQPGPGQDGKGKGGEKGEGQDAEGEGKGSGTGKNQLAQQGRDQQAGDQPGGNQGQAPAGGPMPGSSQAGRGQWSQGGGDDRRRGALADGAQASGQLFFERAREADSPGPLTGKGYEEWADRLREVEQTLDDPKLRNEAAKVLDNARAMRIDYRRNNLPPQAAAVGEKIIAPLVELRERVDEHLSRLDRKNPLAPIDRDPVPPEYRELVKKYYQELGGGR